MSRGTGFRCRCRTRSCTSPCRASRACAHPAGSRSSCCWSRRCSRRAAMTRFERGLATPWKVGSRLRGSCSRRSPRRGPPPTPLVTYPTAATMPPVYRWIADQPGRFAILELPMPFRESEESERDAVRQIWLLYHGKARADGVSGFSSPAHEGFRALMRSFPDPLAVRAVAGRGVRFVIVRYGEYDRPEAARIAHEIVAVRELLPVHAEGSDVVYSLAPADLLAGLGPGPEA